MRAPIGTSFDGHSLFTDLTKRSAKARTRTSKLVNAGDHVQRGQLLARIGDSGDAREPHLHFEVTTSPKLLGGEGVPYLIDQYRVKSADNTWQARTHELPLGEMMVDFGQSSRGPN
jgi:Peptidase family M23